MKNYKTKPLEFILKRLESEGPQSLVRKLKNKGLISSFETGIFLNAFSFTISAIKFHLNEGIDIAKVIEYFFEELEYFRNNKNESLSLKDYKEIKEINRLAFNFKDKNDRVNLNNI